jgi:hypothetical protein
MKSRTPEAIKASIIKMKKIAEVYEDEELELLETYVEDEAPEGANPAVWYLSRALEKLSMADVFIGISDYYTWNGCQLETEAASFYGIKRYQVDPNVIIENYTEVVAGMQNATITYTNY